MLKPVVIIIEQSPADTSPAAVATRNAVASFVDHINTHGEEIYQQYINAPPLKAGFDWFMAPRQVQVESVFKEGAD